MIDPENGRTVGLMAEGCKKIFRCVAGAVLMAVAPAFLYIQDESGQYGMLGRMENQAVFWAHTGRTAAVALLWLATHEHPVTGIVLGYYVVDGLLTATAMAGGNRSSV